MTIKECSYMCVFACVCMQVIHQNVQDSLPPLATPVPAVTSWALAPSGGFCHSVKAGSAKTHQPPQLSRAKVPYRHGPLGL